MWHICSPHQCSLCRWNSFFDSKRYAKMALVTGLSVTRNLTILNLFLFEAQLMFTSRYCDDDNGYLRPTNRYQKSPTDCSEACIKQYPATKYILFQPADGRCYCEMSQTCSTRRQHSSAHVYKIGLYDPSTSLKNQISDARKRLKKWTYDTF